MKGDVSSSVALKNLDMPLLQELRRSQQVLLACIATKGDYGRMLKKKQDIRDAILFAQLDKRFLKP